MCQQFTSLDLQLQSRLQMAGSDAKLVIRERNLYIVCLCVDGVKMAPLVLTAIFISLRSSLLSSFFSDLNSDPNLNLVHGIPWLCHSSRFD